MKEESLILVIGEAVGLMDRASMGDEQVRKMCGVSGGWWGGGVGLWEGACWGGYWGGGLGGVPGGGGGGGGGM